MNMTTMREEVIPTARDPEVRKMMTIEEHHKLAAVVIKLIAETF